MFEDVRNLQVGQQPKHTSKATIEWLRSKHIHMLEELRQLRLCCKTGKSLFTGNLHSV